uniref:histone acetyltransferase n=1 Tax=Pseudictyota dubia TaxID=2749911 RepID=A0A7R9ZBP3_9STRA|mmetsp:Transcript_40036/g.73970  ORF Transcript_40036/g.73970 Transcript_40036/m.73970 type:complete len:216 (+) Transcript_40036:19-666(+)
MSICTFKSQPFDKLVQLPPLNCELPDVISSCLLDKTAQASTSRAECVKLSSGKLVLPTSGKRMFFQCTTPPSEAVEAGSTSLSSFNSSSLPVDGEEGERSSRKRQRTCAEITHPCLSSTIEEEQRSSLCIVAQKQNRLLILRHVTTCPVEIGQRCPVYRCCGEMKVLCEHIKRCKNRSCTTDMCLSSRYIISHYRRCTSASCPVCIPVKRIIQRS